MSRGLIDFVFDFIEWLVKEENKISCRLVGIFLILPGTAYFILSADLFREVLIFLIFFMFFWGIIFILIGFFRKLRK